MSPSKIRKLIRAEVDRRLAAGEINVEQHAACVAQMDAADTPKPYSGKAVRS